MKNRRVGVLMGGASSEREVSLKTGEGVAEQSTTSVRELSLPLAFLALLPVTLLLWRKNVG